MKVLYLTNIPSPYKVDFFNELGKFCELTVLFETKTSTERDEEWKKYHFQSFKGIILKGKRTGVDTAFCPTVTKYLKRGMYDIVVVTMLASLTGILAANTLKRRKIPYYYAGDGGFAGSSTGFKAMLKRYIIAGAKGCFSSSKEFDRYCTTYGAQADHIFRYPFTSVKECERLKQLPTREERLQWKHKFGISEECAVVSVGQFIPRKGFDLLLECSRYLPETVGVYIVGGEPPKEYLKLQDQYQLEHVHFIEFMPKERLMQFYRAMDVFALFTREDIWGLVVNEAMASGLPVISTDSCIAALEMIEHGENGFLIESENTEQMKDALLQLTGSVELRESLAENALRCSEWYTIENMAAEYMRVFRCEGKSL